MVLFLWPLVGFDTHETFEEEEIQGNTTLKYVGEVTDIDEYAGIYVLDLDFGTLRAYTNSGDFEVNDVVVVTVTYGDNTTNWENNIYTVEKVPTTGGLIGGSLLLIGLVMMGMGVTLKKPKLEDLVTFSSKPPVQYQDIPESQQYDPHAIQGQTGTSNTPAADHVTCPKCKNVFGVHGLTPPIKIKCPKCGVEGMLN